MFIDNSKFTKLREASRNGDIKASEILKAFRDGGENVSEMIEEYFAPKKEEAEIEVVKEEPSENREEMSKLEKFLKDNEVTEDSPDYQEYVDEFKSMFPDEEVKEEVKEEVVPEEKEEAESPEAVAFNMKDLIDDESEAIEGYDKKILEITNLQLEETIKLGIIAKLQEIKGDEIRHLNSLQDMENKINSMFNKNEEEQL